MTILVVLGAALLLLGGGGFLAVKYVPRFFRSDRADLLFHTVRPEALEVTVVERGQLEAADNKDVVCLVKATKGGQFSTTIKWVIDDGTHVLANRPERTRDAVKGAYVWPHAGTIPANARAGKPPTKEELADAATAKAFEKLKVWSDLLIELDQSSLEDQERAQQIEVDKAQADVVSAKGQLAITESQNESDYSAAEVDRDLKKLDLTKFEEGEYPQQLADVEGRLEQAKDRAAYSKRMETKGYVSAAAAEGDRLSLLKVVEEHRVLTKFTKERQLTDLKSKVKEAERALKRVETQNQAKKNTAMSDLKTKKGLLAQQEEKLKDIRDQIAICALYAPQDGMVVYYIPEQSRMMSGSQQSTVAQGEPVREGQKLIRIPNLDKMLVNSKVHEAMVSKVKPGMKVDVRIDAYPDRILKGSVRTVATVAMQADWRAADVKMYQVMVSIDDSVVGLKPGMSAETMIFVEASDGKVLTVPVQAIVGGAEMGQTRSCFVRTADGKVEERDITLGISNDKMVEVKSGLVEGDQVVLNPKVLIGTSAKTRNAPDFEKKNGEGKANGNGESKGAGPTASPGAGPSGASGDPAAKGKGKAKGLGGMDGMSDEMKADMKKRMEDFNTAMRKASPQERKKMLEQVPEQFRGQAKERFKAQGIEIPD